MDPARPPRVFLESFTPPAFRIVYRYYYCQQEEGDDLTRLLVQLYWKYQAFNDRLNFEILRAFESEGISLVQVGREEDWRSSSETEPREAKQQPTK
jgi:hypothetical protein